MTRSKLLFTLLAIVFGSQTAWAQCSELFFSEYIEGSSSNKAVEIYNPSGAAVNLSDYAVYLFSNGGTSSSQEDTLSGTLAPYGTFVIANSSADPAIQAVADITSNITFYNGDDAIILVKLSTADTVDVIGEVGVDPGSFWNIGSGTGTGTTQNHTIRRIATVGGGNTDWAASSANEWDDFDIDTFDGLGSHVSNCSPACQLPFFSEYIEGSGSNKAIEIYNPRSDTLDMSDFQVQRHNNGTTNNADTLNFTISLPPYGTYVAGNSSGDPVLVAASDSLSSITFFNGDDALLLIQLSTGDTIDVIGQLGEDPAAGSWPVDTGSTSNFTLRRKFGITNGNNDWAASSASEWDAFPINSFGDLGDHSSVCAPVATTPEINFSATFATVSEADGIASFDVEIANATADTAAVDVMMGMASTATNGADFIWTDTTIVFPANASIPISLTATILEDTDLEGDETIIVMLKNATNGAVVGEDSVLTVVIEDNEYPQYNIDLITADGNGNGIGDSAEADIRVQVRGIVYGPDFDGNNGYSFYLIDSTGGINIFNFNDVPSGYQAQEGDEIIAKGTMTDFRGLTEIQVEEIDSISSGNALADPLEVTVLDESTESEFVKITCLTMLDTTNTSGGVNVNFTNGVDTFTIRMDIDATAFGTDVPLNNKWVDITGIGSQFTFSDPALDGYQLFPRDSADIAARIPDVGFTMDENSVDESTPTLDVAVFQTNGNPDTTEVTVTVASTSTATAGVDYTFADTTVVLTGCADDTVLLPVTIIDEDSIEGDETIVLVITTATNGATVSTDTMVITITETDAIENLLPASAIKMYPNPGTDRIILDAQLNMEEVIVTNMLGQTMIATDGIARRQEINTSNLPAGIYLVRVNTAEGIWVQRWVKK